jgi:hypothetical protein
MLFCFSPLNTWKWVFRMRFYEQMNCRITMKIRLLTNVENKCGYLVWKWWSNFLVHDGCAVTFTTVEWAITDASNEMQGSPKRSCTRSTDSNRASGATGCVSLYDERFRFVPNLRWLSSQKLYGYRYFPVTEVLSSVLLQCQCFIFVSSEFKSPMKHCLEITSVTLEDWSKVYKRNW